MLFAAKGGIHWLGDNETDAPSVNAFKRKKRMIRKYKNELALGFFFFLVLGLMFFMFDALGGAGLKNEIKTSALFDSAAGLVENNYVMIAGVPVGRVDKIEVKFDKALVTMRLEKSAEVRKDVIAKIRAKSLLGEKFIELIPQSATAPLLSDGDRIEKTRASVEIDEVFTAMKPLFDSLEPMTPKLDTTLGELEKLLKTLNETGEKKKETIGSILDKTNSLVIGLDETLQKNRGNIDSSLQRMTKLSGVLQTRAPKMLSKAERTLNRIDEILAAVPVEQIRSTPEKIAKLDRILDAMLSATDKLESNGDRIDRILKNLDILFDRLLNIDELALRRFLQEEGVNVNLSQDNRSKKRIEALKKQQGGGK